MAAEFKQITFQNKTLKTLYTGHNVWIDYHSALSFLGLDLISRSDLMDILMSHKNFQRMVAIPKKSGISTKQLVRFINTECLLKMVKLAYRGYTHADELKKFITSSLCMNVVTVNSTDDIDPANIIHNGRRCKMHHYEDLSWISGWKLIPYRRTYN